MRMMGLIILIVCMVNSALVYAGNDLLAQNGFAYIGQPQDTATHLQALGGYRFYDAQRGHFLKQDSDSVFRGKTLFDGYNYAVGNPVLMVDKNGHLSHAATHVLLGIALYSPIAVFGLYGLFWFCRRGEDPGDEYQHMREVHWQNTISRRAQERPSSTKVKRLPPTQEHGQNETIHSVGGETSSISAQVLEGDKGTRRVPFAEDGASPIPQSGEVLHPDNGEAHVTAVPETEVLLKVKNIPWDPVLGYNIPLM